LRAASGPFSPKPEIEQQISRGRLRRQLGNGKTELADGAGLQILCENIGAGDHGAKEGLVGVLGEIEHDGFFPTIEPNEIAAFAVHEIVVAAREITFGRSILMARASASASRQLHIGAATACSSETARTPKRGRVISTRHRGACPGDPDYWPNALQFSSYRSRQVTFSFAISRVL